MPEEGSNFEGIIGNSPRIREVIARVKAVAATDAPVLIRGESGTGKELVARAIHANSPRRSGRFLGINFAALPEPLVEYELFGHEKRFFVGEPLHRKGQLELADGGTLLLKGVGETSARVQATLLRTLQTGEVVRIGGNDPIPVNVRLLSATIADLEAAVARGAFRPDLYGRLKAEVIDLPPLRERREDIPLLARHFIREFNREHGKEPDDIPEAASAIFKREFAAYDWPGNVRELQNVVERLLGAD